MASLLIRDLDDQVKQRLRIRAAENGVSMEAEARSILATALDADARPTGTDWVRRFREHFADIGYADDLADTVAEGSADGATDRAVPFVGDPEFDPPADPA